MKNALLEVHELHVSYGQIEAVKAVQLVLGEGQIVSVIGPNGAGKTTLLAAIMGLLPSRGGVSFMGKEISSLDAEARVERGLCLVPESRELFGELSVQDNLRLGAYPHRHMRNNGARLQWVYDRFPRLLERRTQRADTLSGGERQMLALGRALMTRPKVLMLDEPSLGLAPLIVNEVLAMVESLRSEGVSVLLVEQNAKAALRCSDFAYVLELGEVSIQGCSSDLETDWRVRQIYLGGETSAVDVRAAATLAG